MSTETVNKITVNPNVLLRNASAPLPQVGMPATVRLWTDSYACVVTRVTPKTITVARVETGPARPDMASDEGAYGLRPTLADGITDRPIPGTEQRYTRCADGQYRREGQRVSLGYSVSRIDWRS